MSYYIPSFICMICISVQIGRSSVRACIWTGPIGPGDTDGPDRTNSIGSIRLGLKSVGPGRYRSGPDRGCPYLDETVNSLCDSSMATFQAFSGECELEEENEALKRQCSSESTVLKSIPKPIQIAAYRQL